MQTSAVHSEIEIANTVGPEQGKGSFGGVGVIGLHEDPAHAGTCPVGFEEARKRRVVASKTR